MVKLWLELGLVLVVEKKCININIMVEMDLTNRGFKNLFLNLKKVF